MVVGMAVALATGLGKPYSRRPSSRVATPQGPVGHLLVHITK